MISKRYKVDSYGFDYLSHKRRAGGRVDVPHVSQGDDDFACVPACVKMIIQYFSGKNHDLPNPDLGQLKRAMDTTEDGTSLNGVLKVNRILKGESVELEFRSKERANLSDITEELDAGRPAIAWIKPNRNNRLAHSVVVKEVSPDGLRIKVQDPAHSEREYEASQFMKIWGNSQFILILATLNKRPAQRELGDFNQ